MHIHIYIYIYIYIYIHISLLPPEASPPELAAAGSARVYPATDGTGRTPDPNQRNLVIAMVSSSITLKLMSHVSKQIIRGSGWGWGFRLHWLPGGRGEGFHARARCSEDPVGEIPWAST